MQLLVLLLRSVDWSVVSSTTEVVYGIVSVGLSSELCIMKSVVVLISNLHLYFTQSPSFLSTMK